MKRNLIVREVFKIQIRMFRSIDKIKRKNNDNKGVYETTVLLTTFIYLLIVNLWN